MVYIIKAEFFSVWEAKNQLQRRDVRYTQLFSFIKNRESLRKKNKIRSLKKRVMNLILIPFFRRQRAFFTIYKYF